LQLEHRRPKRNRGRKRDRSGEPGAASLVRGGLPDLIMERPTPARFGLGIHTPDAVPQTWRYEVRSPRASGHKVTHVVGTP